MRVRSFRCLAAVLLVAVTGTASAAGTYLEVTYPPSDRPGELQLGVTYTLWVPEGITNLRSVIVHQHGCGFGACKGGETAAYPEGNKRRAYFDLVHDVFVVIHGTTVWAYRCRSL